MLGIFVGLVLLNLYYWEATLRSLDKAIESVKWKEVSKDEYVKKSYDFIARRFARVHQSWLKYPWRNFYFTNVWNLKGKGVPCHMQNTLFQRCLLKRFSKQEIKTVVTNSLKKGMIIHFYSKVKMKGKWIDVDVWGKKWRIPFGKNIHNSKTC